MTTFISQWLPRQTRRVLIALALAALCLTGFVLSRPSLPATVVIATSSPDLDAHDAPARAELPHTALRLWLLLPPLLTP